MAKIVEKRSVPEESKLYYKEIMNIFSLHVKYW